MEICSKKVEEVAGFAFFPPKSNYLCVVNAHYFEAGPENLVDYLKFNVNI